MNRNPEQQVRALLGEVIPAGQDETSTMFTSREIADLLETSKNDIRGAAYYGWLEKAANYANLSNVNEGNAARELGELHKYALRMADYYVGWVETPSRGRARIGKIVRSRS